MTETAITSPTEPLGKQLLDFVEAYVNCLDLDRAAVHVGLQPEMGRSLYRRPRVRAEIDRRLEAIESETNRAIAKKRIIDVETLDHNLKRVITISKKELLATPALAAPKVKAIELGYRRVGLLIDDNFVPDEGTVGSRPNETPGIFRTAERHILTHTVTETHEKVVAPEAPLPKPAPRVIDAEPIDDAWKNF